MPSINERKAFKKDIQCRRCGYYIAYVKDLKEYICEVCGTVHTATQMFDKGIQKGKSDPEDFKTKKQKIMDEYGDILEYMENYDPESE